jgi:hypothetical protein
VAGLFNKQSPVHQVVVDAAYQNSRLVNVSAIFRHLSVSYDDDLNLLPLKAFSTLDIRASRPLMRGAEIYVSIRNLSNELIEATKASDGTIGLGTPRLIHAGLSIRF